MRLYAAMLGVTCKFVYNIVLKHARV